MFLLFLRNGRPISNCYFKLCNTWMWHACPYNISIQWLHASNPFILDMLYAVMCCMLHFSYLNAFSDVLPRRIRIIKVLLYICMFVCTYIHKYIYVCVHVHRYRQMYICMYVCMYTHLRVYSKYICINIRSDHTPHQFSDIYTNFFYSLFDTLQLLIQLTALVLQNTSSEQH